MLRCYDVMRAMVRLITILALAATPLSPAFSTSLESSALAKIRRATLEVVMKKPEVDSLQYERPLPFEKLPYVERVDEFISVGTAFSIGANRFATAAHVLARGFSTHYGEPALRDSQGIVRQIDKVHHYSLTQDFAVVSLKDPPASDTSLEVNLEPALDEKVFAVGNALGEGIVVRDGLLTSRTFEERRGEWQWLRFSAATSPGNSGGPLLDAQGRVIGIVLRKSPNENLNYAVPIDLVLNAPTDAAKIVYEITAKLPVMDISESSEQEWTFPLPASFRSLGEASLNKREEMYTALQDVIRQKHADALFPHGQGSELLLYAAPQLGGLGIVIRKQDGNWDVFLPQEAQPAQLEGNGYVAHGALLNVMFVRFRRPDTVPVSTFYGDSKYYMDTLTKAFGWKRAMGSEQIPIVSFGKAQREQDFKDAYGRVWQVRTWNIEHEDRVMISVALPVPDGYLALIHSTPTMAVTNTLRDLQMMASFSYPTYTGTLAQWRDYLTLSHLLPSTFAKYRIEPDHRTTLKFASDRFSLELDSNLQPLLPESVLTLHSTYVRDGNTTVWDVTGLTFIEKLSGGQVISIGRRPKPADSLPQMFQADWERYVERTFPLNATATDYAGTTVIGTVHPYPAVNDASVSDFAYAISVARLGKQPQDDMSDILAKIAKALTIKE